MASGLLSGPDHTTGYRRIVILLVSLVTVPTALLLALGILMMVFYQEAWLNLVFGVLVVTLVACVVTGSILVIIFVQREANLSKLQSDFVSKVSHELRTPLTSIRMFVEMLQAKRVTHPEQVDACFQVLGRETGRLTERIERLLDWGRMEAGKRVYEKQDEEVDEIIADALMAFETVTVGRKVNIHADIAPSMPMVDADRPALVDALVNLLSNAYKYTPDDKEITLTARADGEWIRLSVADNGVGIPRREHRRIFDKFYRVDERLSATIEGSGLGLPIVRHVARAHGGRIELKSEPGKGSTFTLVLPRSRAVQSGIDLHDEPEELVAVGPAGG